MSWTTSVQWNKTRIFILRSLALYLILVFLFVSNYLETYHFFAFLNKPFISTSAFITQKAGSLFLHKKFINSFEFRDLYQTYVALLLYLLIAIVTVLIWTIVDKGEKMSGFFNYVRIFARYYLAAILLGYGISKILGDQF